MQFYPKQDRTVPIREMSNPYVRVVIHAKDRSWKHYSKFKDWKRDVACKQDTGYIGLWKNSPSTVNFTKNIKLPTDGLYLIEIKMHRGPQQTGAVNLKVNDHQISKIVKPKLKYGLDHRYRYPVQYFKAGQHAFKVTLTKTAKIYDINVYKIREYIGGDRCEEIPTNRRLDIISGDFTQNDTTDINTAHIVLPEKVDFLDSNNPNSKHVFDFGDSITIYIGENPYNTQVGFGGYITGLHLPGESENEDNYNLTIDCEDRLMDLQREPLYNAFAMNVAAQQSSSSTDSSATGSEGTTATVESIMQEGAQYSYSHGCSSASCLISGGSGDCFAMSEFLFNKFKAAGIKCKIVQYATSEASNHRSVRIDVGNGWEDAPYRQYFNKTNLFNNTSSSKTSSNIIDSYEGNGTTGTTTTTNVDDGTGYVHHYGCYMGVGGSPCDDIYWENTCYSTTCKGTTHNLLWDTKTAGYHEWNCPYCGTDYDCITGKSKTNPPGADGSLKRWTGATGTANVQEGKSSVVTKYQFTSVYEAARYIALANEYDINVDAIPHDHGFSVAFESLEEYLVVADSCVGFRPEWDVRIGDPKPSLKLTPGKRSGKTSCTIYQDSEGYDASVYKILYLSYYGGGSGAKYQLKGNFKIDMYKENQTIDDAITYNIHFNGSLGQPHTLGGIKTNFNGKWQHENINLKELFDKKANSKEYHITRIAFEGTISTNDLKNRGKTAIWFDSLSGPKSEGISQQNTSLEIKSNFENLQELMDNTDYVAYVKYGNERRDDILVVQPRGIDICSEPASQGYNILEVGQWDYTPKTDGLLNKAQKVYNVSTSDGKNTTKGEKYYHPDSLFWYGPWQTYETLDVQTKSECASKTNADVKNNAFKDPSFTAKLKGCLLFEPGQYIATLINSRNVNGVHMPKDVTHEFNIPNKTYYTTVSFNKPSQLFRKAILNFTKDIENQNIKSVGNIYNGVGIAISGESGKGSFTN